jgi:protein-tyrosine phosphatase
VPFSGITNFRDLGGYRVRSGGSTRWGLVFRADALAGLTSDDLGLYEQLGLRAVYDLRGDVERQERPNPVPATPLALVGRPADEVALPASLTESPTASADDGERFLHTVYLGLIEHAAADLGRLYTALAAGDGLPAVFHCHAGKDRTGIAAALLLEALGVPRNQVLDDYELTARYRLRSQQDSSYQRLIDGGVAPEAAAGILTAPRWAMEHALDDLDESYGGIEPYLEGPAGMEPAVLATLRHRLVARH